MQVRRYNSDFASFDSNAWTKPKGGIRLCRALLLMMMLHFLSILVSLPVVHGDSIFCTIDSRILSFIPARHHWSLPAIIHRRDAHDQSDYYVFSHITVSVLTVSSGSLCAVISSKVSLTVIS
jgi:hypothetical protein